MPTVLQFRRGTTAQNNAFTGSIGEITVNTETGGIRLHDGSTAGGFEMLIKDGSNADISQSVTLTGDVTGSATITNLGNLSITTTIADDSHNHVIGNVDGLQSALDAKAALSGATFTGDVTVNADIVQAESRFESATETVPTTSETAIYTFPYATYGAAEFVITANDGTDKQITKLLVTHNGTTAVATEYGSVFTTSELASYDVSIVGANVQVSATPVSTNTVFKIISTLIE